MNSRLSKLHAFTQTSFNALNLAETKAAEKPKCKAITKSQVIVYHRP